VGSHRCDEKKGEKNKDKRRDAGDLGILDVVEEIID